MVGYLSLRILLVPSHIFSLREGGMEGLRSYSAKRVYETLLSILFPLILAFSPFEVLHSNFSRPLQISSLLISDILSSYCNQFEFKRKFFKNEIMQISNLFTYLKFSRIVSNRRSHPGNITNSVLTRAH